MALFGTQREVSLLHNINRELLGNIISQQASIYKFKLAETPHNIYGEASKEKFYDGPFLFNCLVERQDQIYTLETPGVHFNQIIKTSFLKQDIEDAQIIIEVGDIILYQESYYNISNIVENQYFLGRNPDYPDNINPYSPGLENYGESISLICTAFYIPADKVSISPYKERT